MRGLVIINQQYPPETAATGQLMRGLARTMAASERFESVRLVCGRTFYAKDSGSEFDADAVAIDKDDAENGVLVQRLWNSTFPKQSLPGKLFNHLTFMLSLLFYSIDKNNTVLVTTAPPLAVVILALKKSLMLNPFDLVMSVQDLYPDVLVAAGSANANGLVCRALRAMMRRAMSACRTVAAISTDMAAHLRLMYGLEGVAVIPNPALDSVKTLPFNQEKSRRGWDGRFVVQYSGNFGAAHEYMTMLDVMRLLSGRDDILFHIAGGGSHYDALKREAEALPNAVFEGFAPASELSERLALADLAVVIFDGAFRDVLLPSKYAGILASGRPVLLISGCVNDITRDIQREGIGLCFGHGESEAIAGAIVDLAANPHQARAMGYRARMLYDRAYYTEAAYAKYADMLEG
ncbi:glycosyltransferase WbuB [Clostridia bacterium]|nr:glycosyltransferase WbuB [Clostridia bacterium]